MQRLETLKNNLKNKQTILSKDAVIRKSAHSKISVSNLNLKPSNLYMSIVKAKKTMDVINQLK